jgi:hypothetical protein
LITYNWNISQTDYETANGFIITAHWQCTAVDGEFSASTYSTSSWPSGTPTIPYAEVTMAEVLDWIWANGVDKDATEEKSCGSDRSAEESCNSGGSALVMEITLKLTVEEVNGILQTLGQLPTSSGAWPLVVKIKEQAESQVPQDQAPGE